LSFRGALATKNLEKIYVDDHEILRFALDDIYCGSYIIILILSKASASFSSLAQSEMRM
jgi:hypothetical protein